MNKFSLSALVAAGLLAGAATSASAADLGGNCCADLEERIAELEATTARKGNRKVSLTISGWVAQQVLAWDDGVESNVYVTDTGSVSIGTHVKFSGQATIAPGWTAGYVLNVEAIQNDSLLVDQNTDNGIAPNAQSAVANGAASPLAVESSYWFVKSDTYGRVSVGKQSSAADNQAILPDGSGSLVVANYVLYDVNAFFLRNSNGSLSNLRYANLGTCQTLNGGGGTVADCDGYPNNNVRYDSPTFGGFSLSASWGEDDIWAISGRYAGEFSSFKVAGAIAYNESTDENGPGGVANVGPNFSAAALQLGGYVQHIPTGLFIYGAYGDEYNNTAGSVEVEGDNWYIKPGIRTRLNPLGSTVFYGEYGRANDKLDTASFNSGITDSELTQYGLGVVQEIDAAAMSVWLSWRHYDAEVNCSAAGTCAADANISVGHNEFENFDLFKAGALINF